MKKLLIGLCIFVFSVPCYALNIYESEGNKISLYGSIRVAAGYGNVQSKGETAYSDFFYSLNSNSRIGTNISWGQFFANIELNYKGDGESGLGFRQFYAGWDFGKGGVFKAGNMTVPSGTQAFYSDITFSNNGLAGFGTLGETRRPQVQYSLAGFDIAIISKDRDKLTVNNFAPAESYFPRFDIAYNIKTQSLTGKIAASYALYTQKGNSTLADNTANPYSGKYANINSFHIAGYAKPVFGKAYITASAFFALNAGMNNAVKIYKQAPLNTGITNLLPNIKSNGDIEDVISAGGAIEAGYIFNKSFRAVIAGGFQANMADFFKNASGGDKDLYSYAGYVQAQWKFNPYISIIPEIGYYSSDQNRSDDPDATIMAGAMLRIDF